MQNSIIAVLTFTIISLHNGWFPLPDCNKLGPDTWKQHATGQLPQKGKQPRILPNKNKQIYNINQYIFRYWCKFY